MSDFALYRMFIFLLFHMYSLSIIGAEAPVAGRIEAGFRELGRQGGKKEKGERERESLESY